MTCHYKGNRLLKKHSGLRRTFGALAMLFALLGSFAIAQAQDLATIQNSILSESSAGRRYFEIDMNGDRQGEAELRIDRFLVEIRPNLNSVRFTARFHYVTGNAVIPPMDSPNVTGTITVVEASAGARTGNAIRISFTVRASTSDAPLLGRLRPTNTFDGALRISTDPDSTFMSGVINTTGGASSIAVAAGPYPFSGYMLTRRYSP